MSSASRAVAPWVRTRLRAAPGAALALALLVALTACLAGALPRAVDRYESAGLVHALRDARPDHTTVRVTAELPAPGTFSGDPSPFLRDDLLKQKYAQALRTVGALLPVDPDQSSYGIATTESQPVGDPWIPRPDGVPAKVALASLSGMAEHASVRAGRLPRVPGPLGARTPGIEAAVTAATAKSLHIRVGSVIHVPGVGRPPLAVRVTGILTPRDPGGAYWSTDPLRRTPSLVPVPQSVPPVRYWLGALLIPPDAAPALMYTGGNPERYWYLAPDLSGLRAYDLGGLRSAVASLENGPGLNRTRAATTEFSDVETGLDTVLDSFSGLRSGISPLVAVAGAGTGTVAAVVLLMAGGLAADRRRTELALLRARGASLPGLAGRLLAESTVIAVPAGALGLAAALLLLPGGRARYAVAAAAAVTLTACAALPLRAVLAHRPVQVTAPRDDVATVRPSRRRTVAELTLLVPAGAAVEVLRGRGATGNQLVSLAPVLIGVIAALLLLRLYPPLLRLAAHPAGRLRGAVAQLSLARAARTSASGVLPLLALLTALTTAAFGGSVLTGVAEARDRAALLTVGADARLESSVALPADLAGRVRPLPGVRGVTAVSIAYDAQPGDAPGKVPLVGVDPRTYGELARHTGLGAFSQEVLKQGELKRTALKQKALKQQALKQKALKTTGDGGDGAEAPIPALASPSLAETYGTRTPFPVNLPNGDTVTVRITAVTARTPAITSSDFLIVDRAGLPAADAHPTALLLTGDHLDAGALRRAAGGSANVLVRAEERSRYQASPLQTGAEHVYTAAVVAGAGLALLALLLALLRAAPERAALLARLRTMGLTRAQGRRLLVLESLPQALLAAAGGTLTGWTAIRLLSPGVDLTAIALPSAQTPAGSAVLHPDLWSLTVPALAVVTATVGVAGVQAWWTGRRGAVAELRAGDAR
ncbi:FtsX-like permease family protein [Streptomyces sp. NPDC048297]|uniref:FtsX-like permease family protein n=1 Tax=Streptomyces sp. NPDC048297 TaxID=3365531 RepID=UPI00371EEB2D